MSATQTQQARLVLSPLTDEELEREAIVELERLQRARDAKRAGFEPKRRRRYVNRQ